MLWLSQLIVAQADAAEDVLSMLLKSGNPWIVAIGLLFGADKIAFWLSKLRHPKDDDQDKRDKVLESAAEAIREAARELAEGRREGREAHLRIETQLADVLREVRK